MKSCFYLFEKAFIIFFSLAAFYIGLSFHSRHLLLLFNRIIAALPSFWYKKSSKTKCTKAISISLQLNDHNTTIEFIGRKDLLRKTYLTKYQRGYPQSVVGKTSLLVDKNLFQEVNISKLIRYLDAPISVSGYTYKVENII